MRIFSRSFAGALLGAVGCGEDALEEAAFAELCGVEGPVRVLELAGDQVAEVAPRRVGGRLVFDVGRVEGQPAEQPLLPVEAREVWTTGLCGEAPVRLDERYKKVFLTDHWPEVVLVCDDENNRILSLAAEGPLDPKVVFSGVPCGAEWSPHGVLTPDGRGNLLFAAYPDDPRGPAAVPITLPGGVRMAGVDPMIAITADGVLVLRPDRSLVHFDLGDLSVTEVRAGVGDFVASPSGRYVLWRGVSPADDGTVGVLQPLLLHDRATGVEVGLGEGYLSRFDWQALRWGDQGYVLPPLGDRRETIYRLPDLVNAAVPGGYQLAKIQVTTPVGPLPDGRWILQRDRDSTLHYLDVDGGEPTPMFTRAGQVIGREADATIVLAVFECCTYGRADDEGAVWRVPDDGSGPRKIAGRSTLFGWRLGERGWIAPVDLGGRGARLVHVDTGTREERMIDEHVFPILWMAGASEPDIVRYSVQDGERSGVWQARLR